MRSIGIKVQSEKKILKNVFFVIVESEDEQYNIINSEILKIPPTLEVPLQLKYIRSTVLDIITEYNVSIAGIRISENNSLRNDIMRIQIEGVIQECFASSFVKNYFTETIQSIARKISISCDEYKAIVKNKNSEFNKLNNWSVCAHADAKQAALVALGVLK